MVVQLLQQICRCKLVVIDIGDAMVLGRLFKALFARGVVLVATSNVPPDDLYKEGLQRDRFLPAIEAIIDHTQVYHLDSSSDYRLRALNKATVYYAPLCEAAAKSMQRSFDALVEIAQICLHTGVNRGKIELNGRLVSVIAATAEVLWVDFSTLCIEPRSQRDYIEISYLYKAVLVSHVKQMSDDQNDAARRFINFIDQMYDCRVKLVISAEAVPAELYVGDRLKFEFQRTVSRLEEMQSVEYLQSSQCPPRVQ